MPMMIEVRDERGDGSLEIDIVFPQRIVGINQQCLWQQGEETESGCIFSHHRTGLCERNVPVVRPKKSVKRVAGFAEAADRYYD